MNSSASAHAAVADAVELSAKLFASNPEMDDGELVCLLRSRGVEEDLAERVVAFVPLAFGRVLYADAGPRFPEKYEVRDHNTGQTAAFRLRDEPVFVRALELGRTLLGSDRNAFVEVAGRSGEVNVLSELTAGGAPASRMVLIEPLMMRLPFPKKPPKAWWQFW